MTEFEFVCRYVSNVAGNGQSVEINMEVALTMYKRMVRLLNPEPPIAGPGHGALASLCRSAANSPVEESGPIAIRNKFEGDSDRKIDVSKLDLSNVVKCIEAMITMYSERRSDVEEMLWQILEGEKPDNLYGPEHRYVNGEIEMPNGKVVHICYDTLTTLIEYAFDPYDENKQLEWQQAYCSYRDDDLEDQIHPESTLPEGPAVELSLTVMPQDVESLKRLKNKCQSGIVEHILQLIEDKGKQ
jgi:hypothetical protein